jgi:hypothetical protein
MSDPIGDAFLWLVVCCFNILVWLACLAFCVYLVTVVMHCTGYTAGTHITITLP